MIFFAVLFISKINCKFINPEDQGNNQVYFLFYLFMKKTLLTILLSVFLMSFASAQKVDSIKVEQAGDYIKIGYKILNSRPGQVFRVRVLCSINGGLNTEIRSVSGDTGDNVQGGKPEYFVVWDVLKDVSELKSAEFIVRAELLSGPDLKVEKKNPSSFYLMPSLQLQGPFFGARLGFAGKAGFSVQFLVSNYIPKEARSELGDATLKRISADLTFRAVNKEKFKMHILTGISVGQVIIDDGAIGGYNNHFSPGLEAGLLFFGRRLAFSVAGSRQLYELTEEGSAVSWATGATVGLGLRF